jgi:hypothetical protein
VSRRTTIGRRMRAGLLTALAAVPGSEHVTVDPTPEVGDVAQSNGYVDLDG